MGFNQTLEIELPEIEIEGMNIPIIDSLSVKFMQEVKFVPIRQKEDYLELAVTQPLDFYSLESIALATNCRISMYKAEEKEILKAIEKYYLAATSTMESIVNETEVSYGLTEDEDIDHLKDIASEAPIIRLVNLIIQKAIDMKASDIHLESFEKELKVRCRVDGILHEVEEVPKRLQAAMISRIKIMSKLNIAERRLPQDGRIKINFNGKEIDFRVSTMPTLYGESVVMRILDQSSIHFDLEGFGFSGDILGLFYKMISIPYGMILVTGPTGSGKTTTLYGVLSKINSPEKKIITIEDPIEYNLNGVNQIQVKPSIGLTFANGLRSIVRQDPDVILVGEIRDRETAEIAIQSAMTGHLIFSTLHTNDASGAIIRLEDMGIEEYLISSCLIGVLAQRLVRRICENCKERVLLSREEVRELKGDGFYLPPDNVFNGRGCEKCGNTGYSGRIGIFELLLVDKEIRNLIIGRTDASAIKRKACEDKMMKTLREDGWSKVTEGITTISEVLRVTQEEL
ncbi:MAG: type II secretion system ATPase GspE [Thermodesulfobacteriota bacterium]|nr:type II secretion system ATPase GspE [Thermodesulfobacteriota bacterium]